MHIPLSAHHSPGYKLFEEPLSHMLTQFCTPLFATPHRFFQYTPSLLFLFFCIFLLSITLSPKLVTGMLTSTIYNKIEDGSQPCLVLNISTQQSSFKQSLSSLMTKRTLLSSKSHISRMCPIGTVMCTDLLHKRIL